MVPTRPPASRIVPRKVGSRATSSPLVALRLEATQLVIPPFQVHRLEQRFVQARELRIDLASLAPDLYRVLGVQNFWSEDSNPDLRECLAAVFLARCRGEGCWEEPENWPIECRTLAILGYVDIHCSDQITLLPRDYQHCAASV